MLFVVLLFYETPPTIGQEVLVPATSLDRLTVMVFVVPLCYETPPTIGQEVLMPATLTEWGTIFHLEGWNVCKLFEILLQTRDSSIFLHSFNQIYL